MKIRNKRKEKKKRKDKKSYDEENEILARFVFYKSSTRTRGESF